MLTVSGLFALGWMAAVYFVVVVPGCHFHLLPIPQDLARVAEQAESPVDATADFPFESQWPWL